MPEIGPPPAHRTRHRRAHHVPRLRLVIRDQRENVRGHDDVLGSTARRLRAGAERFEVSLHLVRGVQHRNPAVRDLSGQTHRLGTQRADVDRDTVAERRHLDDVAAEAQHLAFVLYPPASDDLPDDLDVLAKALVGPVKGQAVPVFDDDPAAHAEAEKQPSLRHAVERHGCGGDRRRRAAEDVDHRRAQQDSLGVEGQLGQGKEDIGSEALARPQRVIAQAVGAGEEINGVGAGE